MIYKTLILVLASAAFAVWVRFSCALIIDSGRPAPSRPGAAERIILNLNFQYLQLRSYSRRHLGFGRDSAVMEEMSAILGHLRDCDVNSLH